ncbi:MAG: MBL fold metallo-hydrolase [Xanthobacteraceae bacterium]
MTTLSLTLIGGPTALIEIAGFRLLTDPTFDQPGDYALPHVTLTKTAGPALRADQIGPVDAVLLSHDQHSDNLDHGGRAFVAEASRVLTTVVGAGRLGHGAEGLAPWQSVELVRPDGARLRITATPARHGPAGIEPLAGDVIGFVIEANDPRLTPIYVTGDTVWYDGVAEVARRFAPGVVMPFAGSAQTRGPFHLTMDTNDVVETARAFADALIVPVHHDSWGHFRQTGADLEATFGALGVRDRLVLLQPGVATEIKTGGVAGAR